MKYRLLFLFLCFAAAAAAQHRDSAKVAYDSTIRVYISGYEYKVSIELSVVINGIRLETADKNYRIESFRASWNGATGGICGMHFSGDSMSYMETATGRCLPAGKTPLFFDNIIVHKEGSRFRARPFWIFAALPPGKKNRNFNSPVFIKGHKGADTVDIRVLRSGFKLLVTDTNYKIEKFSFSWNDSKDNICELGSRGDSLDFKGRPLSMGNVVPGVFCFIDDIRAVHQPSGRRMKFPSVFLYIKDEEKPSENKELTVCHDSKRRPLCYSDKTFLLEFSGNKFKGWSIEEQLISYDETGKQMVLADSTNGTGSSVTITLKDSSVIFAYGGDNISIASVSSGSFSLGRFLFHLKKGAHIDTLEFNVRDHSFTIRIYKWSYKNREPWNWDILDWHGNSFFLMKNHWKHQRMGNIMIYDTLSGHEVTMSTGFRSNKRIWLLKSRYIEEITTERYNYWRMVPGSPQFFYYYNRFGRVRKNRSVGEVKICDCG